MITNPFLSTTLMVALSCAALVPSVQAGYDEPRSTVQSAKVTSLPSQSTKLLPFDIIPASGGNIKITPIIHASIQIEYQGKVIIVDPISAGSYRKKADLVLITHSHADHLDVAAIAKVIKPFTGVYVPIRVYSTVSTIKGLRASTVEPGEIHEEFMQIDGVQLRIIPMYNLVHGPKPGMKFHPKEAKWNGYVLKLGGKRIYIAGDTEVTPEMKALKNIDVAFLPMNLPYTMTPQEAAAGALAFKPKVVYPYHFRYPFNKPNSNPQQFATALQGSGIQVRILDWYNPAPVARFMAAMKQ